MVTCPEVTRLPTKPLAFFCLPTTCSSPPQVLLGPGSAHWPEALEPGRNLPGNERSRKWGRGYTPRKSIAVGPLGEREMQAPSGQCAGQAQWTKGGRKAGQEGRGLNARTEAYPGSIRVPRGAPDWGWGTQA